MIQVGSRPGPRRDGKIRLHMEGLPHLKENRTNLKKKSTTFRGFGTERSRLSTFRGFGTERARLGTFRGFGTERARLGTFNQNFEIFTQNEHLPAQRVFLKVLDENPKIVLPAVILEKTSLFFRFFLKFLVLHVLCQSL